MLNDLSDLEIDSLLVSLTKVSRAHSPATSGLAVYGQHNCRELLRETCRKWLDALQPETQR